MFFSEDLEPHDVHKSFTEDYNSDNLIKVLLGFLTV